jgi:hypothetical protein
MDGHNEWLTDFCGCCENSKDEGAYMFAFVCITNLTYAFILYSAVDAPRCFPIFFPRAFSCPCGLFGRIESLLENEIEINCCCFSLCLPGIGLEGLAWCMCASLCNFCLPLPLSPAFGCLTVYQRWRIMDQFNIDGGCCEIMKGCCYPCALYQQFVFLHEMKRKRMLDDNTSVSNCSLDSGLLGSSLKSRSTNV